ncbi:MAG TPA: hypothetical protein VIP28_10990 [Nocardioides sp.]
MTTLHRHPSPLELQCEALEHGQTMSRSEAWRKAEIANLRDSIADCEQMLASATAAGNHGEMGRWASRAAEYRRELEQLEAKS